eukprot:447430_1
MCDFRLRLVTIIWIVLAMIMLPICIWALYQHIKSQKQKPLANVLHILIISVYICTIIALIGTILQGFTLCSTASEAAFGFITPFWFVQQMGWTCQWAFVIAILFLRLHYVFKGSSYGLSKYTIISFSIIYITFVFSILLAFIGLSGIRVLFLLSYLLYIIVTITFSIYLPILFIRKLIQVNTAAMKNQMELSSPSASGESKSKSKNKSESSKNEKRKQNLFLTVITKCAILTIVSIISTWIVFVCSILYNVFQIQNNSILMSIWSIALVMDINTNFICIMLSNTYCKTQYTYICGRLDKVCRSCCLSGNAQVDNKINKTEKELSSYMETTANSK